MFPPTSNKIVDLVGIYFDYIKREKLPWENTLLFWGLRCQVKFIKYFNSNKKREDFLLTVFLTVENKIQKEKLYICNYLTTKI